MTVLNNETANDFSRERFVRHLECVGRISLEAVMDVLNPLTKLLVVWFRLQRR